MINILDNINTFEPITSSLRLILRKVNENDLDDIYEYTSNNSVCKHLSWHPHKNKLQTLSFIKNTLSQYKELDERFTFAIHSIKLNKLIGVISIFNVSNTSKRVELSYILNPKYQGNGFMSEALKLLFSFLFNNINVVRIQTRCSKDNIASEKLMKSVGMTYEGTLTKFWFIKGKYKDVLMYSIFNDK